MSTKRQDYQTANIPLKPGVYVFRDSFSKVIYVGKAKVLRRRLSSYFQPSRLRTADPKLRSLINSIAFFEIFPVKTESEALLLESRFIKEYAPKYNVLLRDDKRFLLIRINLNDPFPLLQLVRLKKNDSATYYGPFPHAAALKQTLEFLTVYFGLRSCSPLVPGAEDRKHCKEHILRNCCSPCDNSVDEAQYRQRVEQLLEVFSGKVSDLVIDLEDEMQLHVEAMRYEKAAKVRDIIANLRSIFNPQRRFTQKTIASSSGSEAVKELQHYLELKRQPRVIECFDNSNFQGAYAVASMVQFIDGKPATGNYRHFRIKTVSGIDDFASMNEIVTRRYSRIIAEDRDLPDMVLIDGGKGQLSSAYAALCELGLNHLPVFGLAKKREEIFCVDRDEPILIDHHRPALRLVQHLRDEAHRFAITYHRKLRQKAVTDSILDQVEGIGAKRKLQLLKAFSSVANLRKKTAAEISDQCPGIGFDLAEKILQEINKKD